MDFTLSSEQIELQESVRKFAKNELTAVAAEIERTGKPPTKKIIQKSYLSIVNIMQSSNAYLVREAQKTFKR